MTERIQRTDTVFLSCLDVSVRGCSGEKALGGSYGFVHGAAGVQAEQRVFGSKDTEKASLFGRYEPHSFHYSPEAVADLGYLLEVR